MHKIIQVGLQTNLLQIIYDGISKLVGSIMAAQILSTNFSSFKNSNNSILNAIAICRQINMSQHFGTAQKHSSWIGNIFANRFRKCMTCPLQNSSEVFKNQYLIIGKTFLLTGSKTHVSGEYEAPATTPAPPTIPLAILSMILPYKFGATITSN